MRLLRHGGRLLAALVLVGVAGAGCANRMHDENEALHQQNRELQARLDAERAREAQTGPAEMEPIVTQAPQPPAPQPTAPATQPAARQAAATITPIPPQIEGTETTTDVVAGTMTVRVPGDVVFDAGKATIREGAKPTLDKIAAALKKDYAGKQVRVEGHTDSDPIRVSRWTSNQELSEARAAAVKTYLAQKGVDGNSVTTRGFGADRPKGPDKAANRRVEIVVVTR